MSKWKPIDTAPKEGQFLVWGPSMTVFCEDLYSKPHNETGDVALVRYLEDPPRKDCGHLWVEHSVYYHSVVQGATHWTPVPKVQ